MESEGATEEWLLADEKVAALKLKLVDPNAANSTEFFLIHIEGETARFKAAFD